jgi:hypothetical protein
LPAVIVVDPDFRVIQMPDQLGPLPICVAERLTDRTVRRRGGQEIIDPGFELLQNRLGLLLAWLQHGLERQGLPALFTKGVFRNLPKVTVSCESFRASGDLLREHRR